MISDFTSALVCKTAVHAGRKVIFYVLKKIIRNVMKHSLSTFVHSTQVQFENAPST